jgi:hypothetical protein
MYPLAILAGFSTIVLALLRRWPVLPVLYLVFGCISTATIGTIGAYINHLLEAAAAMFLACGLLLGRASASKRRVWSLVASAALLIQVATLVHLPYSLQAGVLEPWVAWRQAVRPWFRQNRASYLWTPAPADAQVADELSQRVQRTPGLILSEDGSFTTTHGRPMWIQFLDFALLTRFGFWDQAPFVNQIRSHQFALLLLKFDAATDVLSYRNIVTPEVLEAIRSSYVLDKQIWLYYVYVPRAAPTE